MTIRKTIGTLLLLAAAFPAAAQQTQSDISGYVKDDTGAVLPGVTVTVAFPEIAVTRQAWTNADGYYLLTSLPNGPAVLTAELQGFKKVRRELTLELNQKARVDLAVEMGAFTEVIEVTSDQPLISSRADVGHVITGDQTKELAIDGRTYMQLLTLLPGVSSNNSSYEFGTSFRADGQQINGLRKNLSGLTVDGAENLDAGSNATQVNNLSVDAIEEVAVLSSQYSAEYGRSGGAAVNVVTKRGKKDFHGTVYAFGRDDSLDEADFATGDKSPLDFKNFGWNLSGPIKVGGFNSDRSRLFFFIGQEYKNLETAVGMTKTNVAVPSLRERVGDFSQSNLRPRDPLTGQPFPGNVIPANRLSANGLRLVALYPEPDAGQTNLVTLTPIQKRDIREDIVRLDYKTSESSNLTLRFIKDVSDQIEPYGSFGGGAGNTTFPTVPTSHERLSDSLLLSFTQTLGKTMTNEVSVSAVRNNQDLAQTGDLYQRDGYTGSELFPSNRGGRLPNVTDLPGFPTGSSGLLGQNYPTHIIGNYYTLKDNFTWVRGAHTLKFGIYVAHNRKSEEIRTADAGSFTFSNSRPGGTGVALADALLGLASTYTESDAAPLGNLRYDQFEIYAHDHWQVRKNLTLDIGVRYQLMPGPVERQNLISTFDPARYDRSQAPQVNASGVVPNTGVLDERGFPVTGIARAGVDGVPRNLYDTDFDNIAPRFGFTWDPWNSGKTAIRGGIGVYYDRPVFNSSRDQAASPPWVRTVQLSNPTVDDPASGRASTNPLGGFDALATDFPMPVVYSYSLGFQRTLPGSVAVDVNYVGNQARNLLRVRELNYVTPSATTGLAPTPVNANRPYVGYGRIFVNETTGKSGYNSLQVAINRRPRDKSSLTVGLSYTLSWAKGDSDSEDSSSSSSMAQDPRDLGAEWGYQDFDRRHVLAVNYVYRLPFFRDQKGAAGRILGGWEISGVTKLNTGRRLNITAGNNTTIFGDTVTLRANAVPGQDPMLPSSQRTADKWFNTDAFAAPPAGQLGTLPRNSMVGPSFHNWDVSLFKNVRLAGKAKMQLRAEAFNVFNIENYRDVETSRTSANFGKVTRWESPRILQLGMKLMF